MNNILRYLFIFLFIIPLTILAQDEQEPNINSLQFVDEEPKPINMAEVAQAIGYPEEAIKKGINGMVVVRILVDKEGNYVKHKIIKSPNPIFDKPVDKHVKDLKFTPAIQKGQKVSFWVNVPFRFQLEEKKTNILELQKQAIERFSKQIEANPSDYKLFLSRGFAYYEMSRFNDAIQDFQKSIDLNPQKKKKKENTIPEFFYAHHARGKAKLALQEWDLAKTYFDEAIKIGESIKDRDSSINQVLSTAYVERGITQFYNKDYPAALADYETGKKISPNQKCDIAPLVSEVKLMLKDYKGVVKALKVSLGCDSSASNFYNLGYYQIKTQEYEEAITNLSTVLKNSTNQPLNAATYKYRGFCYLRTDNAEQAMQDFLKAKELDPLNEQLYYYIGLAHLALGDKQKACDNINDAIILGWDEPNEMTDAAQIVKTNCE